MMREVIAELYETVELKPGVRTMLAKLQAEGARMCIRSNLGRTVPHRAYPAGHRAVFVLVDKSTWCVETRNCGMSLLQGASMCSL